MIKSNKGIALILVLGAVAIMTAMVIEFAYNTNINYHLARNDLERLKAQYLAQSAYRFMQVELKFDRVYRQVIQSQNLGQFLGANANLPLCQQFPISTGLIRAVFLGGEGGDALPEELKKMVSMSQETDAAEFLKFEGDFDGECIDESTKLNLNYFYGLNPLQKMPDGSRNAYDKFKIDLMSFLGVEAYREAFEDADVKVQDVVRNIADWVDKNEVVNELDGVEAGPEIAVYDRLGRSYPVKNGKFTTFEEVYLVEGVVDLWFTPLQNYFTVYGDNGLVNVCSAEDRVVQIVIRHYVDGNTALPPIKIDDPETMGKLVDAVREGCSMGGMGDQLKQQIAQSLNTAIGAIAGSEETEGGTKGPSFTSLVTTEPRFFSLVLTGSAGDTAVRIKAVLDIKESDPKKWKLLYWRVY